MEVVKTFVLTPDHHTDADVNRKDTLCPLIDTIAQVFKEIDGRICSGFHKSS